MNIEYCQIGIASFLSGPLTWPIAVILIQRQNGNFKTTFIQVLKNNGVRVAFRGVFPYSMYKLFGIGTQRGVQHPVNNYLEEQSNIHDYLRFILSGVASGVIGGVLVTPLEQYKLSLANRDFSTSSETRSYFSKNPIGLMQGMKITILRNVVFDSVNALSYQLCLRLSFVDKTSAMQMSLINCVCGVFTAIIDYPLDVLKTRIQSGTYIRLLNNISSPSIYSVANELILAKGISALYFGLRQKLFLYGSVWAIYGYIYASVGKALS